MTLTNRVRLELSAVEVDRDRVGCEIETCGATITDSVLGIGRERGILKSEGSAESARKTPPDPRRETRGLNYYPVAKLLNLEIQTGTRGNYESTCMAGTVTPPHKGRMT